MKTFLVVLLLVLTSPVIAADTDGNLLDSSYVADEIDVVNLPNGEVITRLVSRKNLTVHQLWVDSVYQQQTKIPVFQCHSAKSWACARSLKDF